MKFSSPTDAQGVLAILGMTSIATLCSDREQMDAAVKGAENGSTEDSSGASTALAALESYASETERLRVFRRRLQQGVQLVKHGRYGRPHPTVVRVTSGPHAQVMWKSAKKRHTERAMALDNVVAVESGRDSSAVQVHLVTEKRSVVFEAKTTEDRNMLVWGFRALIRDQAVH